MNRRAKLALSAGAVLVLTAGAARAGILEDEEARKAILDLRAKLQATDGRLADLAASNAKLLDQVDQLRRSLLDLNNQIQSDRADAAKLRGTQEQLVRDLTDTQRSQKDSLAAIDERLRKLEPTQVSVDGKSFVAAPQERRTYEQAMGTLRTGDFDKASTLLAAFIATYPNSGYLDSARFWLGNAYYGKKDYKAAIATFKGLVTASPDTPRAPEAMLAMANCQVEMKDTRSARRTLDDLVKNYPNSEAASAAKERLATIKG